MDNLKATLTITPECIAIICLNRPQVRNAFDEEMIALLIQYLEEVNQQPTIKALVIKANGKHFSAGADLNWMARMAKNSPQDNLADAKQLAKLMSTLDLMNMPTIAVIQGAAYGGAVGLTACCDMVFAAEDSSFCLSEVKIGLIPSTISPYVLRAIGERQARRYFLSAEVFDATQAKNIGLVHETRPSDTLESSSLQWVEQLLKNAPTAVRKAKQLAIDVSLKPISSRLIEQTAQSIADIRSTSEAKEGLDAFLNKRKPNWQSN